ncbi:MAG: ABC transporter permease subunit [Propionibacteriales bacterium]|nr:ABC transporter permease subunit [Propionibacteriales bacterium]
MTVTEDRAIAELDTGAAQETIPSRATGGRTLSGYLFMPVLLAAVLLVLYLWVSNQELEERESARLNRDTIISDVIKHIELTALSTLLVLIIAIPLGVLLTRPALGRITRPTVVIFSIGAAVPSAGVLFLFAEVWNVGFLPAIAALVLYTTIVVLRNTMVGLQQVDPAVIESARGMGMTKIAVLIRIELPLAVPIIMAGVRTALVINVGTAALAALVGAGGLGGIINAGISANRAVVTLVGAVLTAVLALAVDYVAGIAEDLLRPRGL